MPYIGKSPLHGNYNELTDISGDFDGSTTQFALTEANSSLALTPVSPATMIISINGVVQEPTTAYTVSGTNITFTSAPASTDSFFGVALGNQLDIGTPSDSTVTSAKLGSTFFTGATDIGAAIVDADLFLMDDGAGGTIRKTTASRLKTYCGSSDPASADGDSLGTASLEWSDLYLAEGGVIYFGNDQDVTVTHDPDDGLFLKSIATADNNPFVLTLQTGETDMAANDVLGQINFQAPDEGTGTDAILVAASIKAVAEGDFSSSSNATSLRFHTGSSEDASSAGAQMSITSAGKVGINDTTPDAMLDVYSDSGTSTDIARFEAAVGSYTGTSMVAANTLGSASSFNLITGVTDSDGDASGPFTVFKVRGDGQVTLDTALASTDLFIIKTSGNSGTGLYVNSQTSNQIDVVGYDGSAATALNLRSGGASGAGILVDTSNNVAISTNLKVGDGSTSTPSVHGTTSTNAGIFFPAADHMSVTIGGSELTRFGSNMIMHNETANGGMTVGVTINQGGQDNEILALKSSDCAHGITGIAETDTYGLFRKYSATEAGLAVEALSEGTTAFWSRHVGTGENTTDATTSVANTNHIFALKDGTGKTPYGSTGNMVLWSNDGTARVLFKGDGTVHASDTSWATSLDTEDDMKALCMLDKAQSTKGIINSAWDSMIGTDWEYLQKIGIAGSNHPEKGHPDMFSIQGVQKLTMGATWYLGQNFMAFLEVMETEMPGIRNKFEKHMLEQSGRPAMLTEN